MFIRMASIGRAKIVELYYDVASPYSWLAFETLCRYRSHWNIELVFRPILLGGIFHARSAREGRKPSLNPRKGVYSTVDLQRLSKYFEIPINQPADFWNVLVTKGTLRPQRFITAVNFSHPQFTEELSRQLWRRIYVQAALKAGMNEVIIEDTLTQMTETKVKEKLKAVTQEALDLGAFGAPFIVVHVNGKKEIFFGSDRFHVMAMIIGETWKGPLPDRSSHL